MSIKKYELYVDNYQDDNGDDCRNVEHIGDDGGDWCKASDVDELQEHHATEIKLVRAASERLFRDNKKLQADVYILATTRATLADENEKLLNEIKDMEQKS